MFGSLSTSLFECLQLGNPQGKPLRRLDQPVALKRRVVHFPPRGDQITDEWVERPRPSFLSRSLGLFGSRLNIGEDAADLLRFRVLSERGGESAIEQDRFSLARASIRCAPPWRSSIMQLQPRSGGR
jgi:hypothetical protein